MLLDKDQYICYLNTIFLVDNHCLLRIQDDSPGMDLQNILVGMYMHQHYASLCILN